MEYGGMTDYEFYKKKFWSLGNWFHNSGNWNHFFDRKYDGN